MKFSHIFFYVACSQHIDAAEVQESLLRGKKSLESNIARALQAGSVGTVTKLVLINATLGNKGQALIDPIHNGTIVNLASYPAGQSFSVKAVTSTISGPIGSVQFMFDEIVNFQTESTSPYAMCRDVEGVFKPCTQLVVGKHTVATVPYSLANAAGIKGRQVIVSFSIVNTNIVPTKAPQSTPVAIPKSTPVQTPVAIPIF